MTPHNRNDNFDEEAQKENAEVQAELERYNQQHGTEYADATAFFYECEGGAIRRDDLSDFPKLLEIWDSTNQTNEWLAEDDGQSADVVKEDGSDDLPDLYRS